MAGDGGVEARGVRLVHAVGVDVHDEVVDGQTGYGRED